MASQLPVVPHLPELPAQTQVDFLAMFQRILPAHYLQPLQEPGPGYELLLAFSKLGERISDAVSHVANGNFIATAGDGSYAEGAIAFYRATPTWGPVRLEVGTIVGTASGYTYTTQSPLVFDAGEVGPFQIPVRATVRGWLYNQPGPVELASGEVVPGPIDRLISPNLNPAIPPSNGNFDPTIKVMQVTDVTGGSSPMLDGLGYDRGVIRADNESTVDYRQRIFSLPDTVTPTAIAATIERIIGPTMTAQGLRWWVYEGWDLRVQMCWDAPINEMFDHSELNAPVTPFNANIFAWDYAPTTTDAYQPGGWTNLVLESDDYGASIILGLPDRPDLFGLYASLAQNLNQVKPAGVPVYYLTA